MLETNEEECDKAGRVFDFWNTIEINDSQWKRKIKFPQAVVTDF